jgi:hypothetical protein
LEIERGIFLVSSPELVSTGNTTHGVMMKTIFVARSHVKIFGNAFKVRDIVV